MKKVVAFILAAFMAPLFSISAFAEKSSTTEDCKNFGYFFDEDEFSQVIVQAIANPLMKMENQITAMSADYADEYNGYKEFMVSYKFLTDLENGKQLDELLPEEYTWVIPNNVGGETDVAKKSGRWEVVGYSRALLESSDTADDRMDIVDTVNSALDLITEDIIDVVCVKIPVYHGSFVCITTNNSPYLISLNANPEFTGLENGRLYDFSEANDNLYQNYGSMDVNADIVKGRSVDELTFEDFIHFKYGGGGKAVQQETVQEQQSVEIPVLPIILIPAAAIIGIITVLLLIWNKSSRKHTK